MSPPAAAFFAYVNLTGSAPSQRIRGVSGPLPTVYGAISQSGPCKLQVVEVMSSVELRYWETPRKPSGQRHRLHVEGSDPALGHHVGFEGSVLRCHVARAFVSFVLQCSIFSQFHGSFSFGMRLLLLFLFVLVAPFIIFSARDAAQSQV